MEESHEKSYYDPQKDEQGYLDLPDDAPPGSDEGLDGVKETQSSSSSTLDEQTRRAADVDWVMRVINGNDDPDKPQESLAFTPKD